MTQLFLFRHSTGVLSLDLEREMERLPDQENVIEREFHWLTTPLPQDGPWTSVFRAKRTHACTRVSRGTDDALLVGVLVESTAPTTETSSRAHTADSSVGPSVVSLVSPF